MDLVPFDCEQCDCQQYRWNGASWARWESSRCECGHFSYRHRYREISRAELLRRGY